MAEEKSNVVLIGMPGAGKSTLGIVLAKIMALKFVDADLVIQEQMDKTLQTIIDAMGPDGFIQVENEILSDLEAEETVIATGGSAIYSDEAMKHLSDIGVVVYLEISYDSLKGRLGDLQERGVAGNGANHPKNSRHVVDMVMADEHVVDLRGLDARALQVAKNGVAATTVG